MALKFLEVPGWLEFGLKVRFWVPQFHALAGDNPDDRYVVTIDPGEEALWPRAARFEVRSRRPHDDARRGRPPKLYDREARFLPEPFVDVELPSTPDVVVCPRARSYGSSKNWPEWYRLALALRDLKGWEVHAAGAPDSSSKAPTDMVRAWDFERFTDATVAMLRAARLCIATDAGLAHLALLCGCPLLMLTHEGRTAPGPVVDASGRQLAPAYGNVKLEHYYKAANHEGVGIWQEPEAWADWTRVLDKADSLLRTAVLTA